MHVIPSPCETRQYLNTKDTREGLGRKSTFFHAGPEGCNLYREFKVLLIQFKNKKKGNKKLFLQHSETYFRLSTALLLLHHYQRSQLNYLLDSLRV